MMIAGNLLEVDDYVVDAYELLLLYCMAAVVVNYVDRTVLGVRPLDDAFQFPACCQCVVAAAIADANRPLNLLSIRKLVIIQAQSRIIRVIKVMFVYICDTKYFENILVKC